MLCVFGLTQLFWISFKVDMAGVYFLKVLYESKDWKVMNSNCELLSISSKTEEIIVKVVRS